MGRFTLDQDATSSTYGCMVADEHGYYVKNYDFEKEVGLLEQDVITLVLRLMGEDKYTHSPETLHVLEKWETRVNTLIQGGGENERTWFASG